MFNFIQTLLFTTKCLISLYSTGGEDSWEWRQYFDLTQHNANNPTSFRPRCHNYLRDEFQSFLVWLTELSLWTSWRWATPSWFLHNGHLHCRVHHLAETIFPYCIWVWLSGVKCSILHLQSNDALKFSGFLPQRRYVFPSGFGLEHFCCWVQLDFAKIFFQICLPLLFTNRWRDRVTSLVKNKFSFSGMFVLISSMSFLIPPTAYPARCGLLLTTLLVDF